MLIKNRTLWIYGRFPQRLHINPIFKIIIYQQRYLSVGVLEEGTGFEIVEKKILDKEKEILIDDNTILSYCSLLFV